MNYRKYKIDNNIIHELIINNIFDIKNIIGYEKSKSIFNISDDFFNEFINKYSILNKYKFWKGFIKTWQLKEEKFPWTVIQLLLT